MDTFQGPLFLRPIQLRRPKLRQEPSNQEEPAKDERHWLYCRLCSARITTQDQAININGRHQHAFFNPAGIAFEIRCFQAAPGVLPQDAPSEDFSWFPGFSWQIVLCANCQSHLGWRFLHRTASHVFFGLIDSRLLSR
ncbi:MAG: cereblon family protein [Desulfobulbus sp.]|nr:cereblon family protein [Desulfobulbus sp.]